MNGLALCAGVGGMELGLHLALGRNYRTVGYVEREAFAAATLVARMEDSAMDRAPIWDDLSSFDGRAMRGCVDVVSSGLPCQPYSVAGLQKADADSRALWPEFVRIVGECRPGLVFIENVPGFRKHFEPVWRELRDMGFEWAPPLLSTASESGAIHIRERFFALAAHPERVELWDEQRGSGGTSRSGTAELASDGDADTNADCEGLEGRGVCGSERSDQWPTREVRSALADRDGWRLDGEWCGWLFDEERQTFRHDPDRCDCRSRIKGSLWDSESPPVRMDARSTHWVDELRAIGNVGTPPVVYARAFLTLAGTLRGEG